MNSKATCFQSKRRDEQIREQEKVIRNSGLLKQCTSGQLIGRAVTGRMSDRGPIVVWEEIKKVERSLYRVVARKAGNLKIRLDHE